VTNQTKSKRNLNYQNITISGLPGAGSSTLGKALAQVLSWKYFSGGDFMRAHAIRKGFFDPNNKSHHLATVYSDDFDRQVDFGMRKTLQNNKNHILDSWLSGFVAQGITNTLKVLVFCNQDAIRVDRIANRDGIAIKQAKHHIFDREKKNVAKWKRMYKSEWQKWVVKTGKIPESKPIWFWYEELYDLTIDTFKFSKEETLKIALEKLGYPNKNVNYQQVFTSI
jgi:cytidylate kinase